jgi:hypothetical protein
MGFDNRFYLWVNGGYGFLKQPNPAGAGSVNRCQLAITTFFNIGQQTEP